MTDYKKYLRPDIVSRLSGLEIKARLVVEGFIAGLHRSPYHGFSVEFAEHRQYMPGDPLKNIDWKVYSRTDRFFVKEFEEETNLKAYLLLDISGSMGYHSNGISKLEYGSYLCAALSYLMLQQRDSVGLVVFDQKIQKYIPPKSAATHLHVLLSELDKIQASQTTNVSSALHEMAERIKRRGLIILLSDLFDSPEKIMSGLKHFRHRKHEVIVFHILDPRERDFSFPQEAIFKDIETQEEILTSPWQIQKDYQAKLQEWIEKYRLESRESLIDYVLLDTSVPFDEALFAYLSKRQRLF
ncbi:MAG: hypothetical protein RBG1_1C00001G0202 [candidate division Zixibacteria bacterium RBG-1]|nr:MAG: hypothetical protein RBG1_1C00001G0202 [candidate division Zixibacteria bacterium RBG-1]OGC85527.1 MAG: hypothetical protein A2V73_09285 [candidate division Zixibacteria bacterium RBG_19FT_COMBO_42_43]